MQDHAPPTSPLPPPSAWSAALIAVVIGFGGTIALIVQALSGLGASVEQCGSAVTALCLGIAIPGAALSFRLRMPVVLAWSTPGAALLATGASGLSWPAAVACFVASGLMMTAVGVVPALSGLAARIPPAVASAMLAGVLLPFCLKLFATAGADPLLVAALLAVFLASRQRVPLYAMLLVLATGAALALFRGQVHALAPGPVWGTLRATVPAPTVQAVLSVGVPLFLVTLISQNLPGLVVLRSAEFAPPAGVLLTATGVASALLAPFGAHAVNLAAITAALCTGRDAHPDAGRRWTVGVLYGGFYLAMALVAPWLVRLFLALPHEVIVALTGVALIPALVGALDTALASAGERDAAIVTFLATGSGLSLFGLGSAFWGLVAGFAAVAARAWLGRRRRTGPA